MKNKMLFIVITIIFIGQAFGQENINQGRFDQKKLEINLTYGSKYQIDKSPDQYIYITLVEEGNPYFKYEIEDLADKIVLKEINTKYNPNKPTPKSNNSWKILLPEYSELYGNGATVDVKINNVNGIFKISSASGKVKINNAGGVFDIIGASTDIELNNLTGKFNLSSTIGNIKAQDLTIVGNSKFVTNDGNINVTLAETLESDINISTGSGTGILDFNENDLIGEFTFKARKKYGKIISPFDFQTEEVILDDINYYEKRTDFGKKTEYDVKSFTIKSGKFKVMISTVTGKAKLLK